MILQNKTSVVYGGSGHVGGEIARVFAREGARVFLAGRKLDELEKHGADIGAAGVAHVDAGDRAGAMTRTVMNLSCGSVTD
ncbi:hypothetical protein JIG36_03480 [Actinoplanes sp. LDG1-06]|uniref:Uncharacterized protein n=1 Tax=Paractinoplanes ovalisporus TaxID=2810368 RepID=A0ABS2A4I0_9ACTN|nr:hypothetical protein [Actinoplanes ovalisporus]MBM2614615.1 hypothetical protein [Actinoplanes ovalisporus]